MMRLPLTLLVSFVPLAHIKYIGFFLSQLIAKS